VAFTNWGTLPKVGEKLYLQTMLENDEKNLDELLLEFESKPNETSDDKIRKLCGLEKLPKSKAIEVLNNIIYKEPEAQVLLHIVKTIAKYNDKSSLGPLVDLLLLKKEHQNIKNLDEFLKVRCLATSILGNLRHNDAVMPLLYILNNKYENYKLRLSAAEALGKIGDSYAVAPLIDIVSNEEEKSVYLRESAAKALGMLNDIRAIDPLLRILEAKKGIVDKFTFLKERIIEAIGRIGSKDDKIFRALSNALLDESAYIRLSAIETLAELDDDRVLDLLRPMINDEEEDVARGAISAIYTLTDKDYITKLYDNPDLPGWCKDEIETILEEENVDDEYEEE
jgi:HEAT repeat protein